MNILMYLHAKINILTLGHHLLILLVLYMNEKFGLDNQYLIFHCIG